MLVVVRKAGELTFSTLSERAKAGSGDTVVSFAPPVQRSTKAKPDRPARSRPVATGNNTKSMERGRLP